MNAGLREHPFSATRRIEATCSRTKINATLLTSSLLGGSVEVRRERSNTNGYRVYIQQSWPDPGAIRRGSGAIEPSTKPARGMDIPCCWTNIRWLAGGGSVGVAGGC